MTRWKRRGAKATEKDTGAAPPRRRVPKLCGADVELGNFVLGLEHSTGTGVEASRALLRKIEGVSSTSGSLASSSSFL